MARYVALVDGGAGAYGVTCRIFRDARRQAARPTKLSEMPSKPRGSGPRTRWRTGKNFPHHDQSRCCAVILRSLQLLPKQVAISTGYHYFYEK
jgi:hypothetical protein